MEVFVCFGLQTLAKKANNTEGSITILQHREMHCAGWWLPWAFMTAAILALALRSGLTAEELTMFGRRAGAALIRRAPPSRWTGNIFSRRRSASQVCSERY